MRAGFVFVKLKAFMDKVVAGGENSLRGRTGHGTWTERRPV